MKTSNLKKSINILICSILSISYFSLQKTANAFIPYIYTPDSSVLRNTSIGVGLTASQYIKIGQTQQAIELSKLAVSLNPEEADLWILLSTAQLNNKLFKEALSSINKATLLDNTNSSVWFTKPWAYKNSSDYLHVQFQYLELNPNTQELP